MMIPAPAHRAESTTPCPPDQSLREESRRFADARRKPNMEVGSACGRIPLKKSKSESSKISARNVNSREFRLDWPLHSISELHKAGAVIWLPSRPKIATAPVRPGSFPISSGNGLFQRYRPESRPSCPISAFGCRFTPESGPGDAGCAAPVRHMPPAWPVAEPRVRAVHSACL